MTNTPIESSEDNPESEHKILSPLIIFTVQCPVCGFEDVKCHTLKAKTLPVRHNVLEVPIYEPNPKFHYVDFNELQFTVCPECLYVGANKSDFKSHNPVTGSFQESKSDKRILRYWETNMSKIAKTYKTPTIQPENFHNPRTPEAILLAIRLAIFKAKLEIQAKIPYAHFKRAHRYLKYYCECLRLTGTADDEILRKTIVDLEEVFRLSDFPDMTHEFEVCYLVVACAIKLNEEEKAGEWIKALDKTKGDLAVKAKENPRIPAQEAAKWSQKSKDLWQNRNDPTVWKFD